MPNGLSIDWAKLGGARDGKGPLGRGIPMVLNPLIPDDIISVEGKVAGVGAVPTDDAVVVVIVV